MYGTYKEYIPKQKKKPKLAFHLYNYDYTNSYITYMPLGIGHENISIKELEAK